MRNFREKFVRYAKRRRTTTTIKRDEEIPPFFLSSAVPRRFTAISSKRRAHERGFENRGGVFRVSRRGGEFFSSRVCFLFLKLTKSEIYTADTFRVSLSFSFYSLSLCACMTRDSIAHQTLFLLFPSSFERTHFMIKTERVGAKTPRGRRVVETENVEPPIRSRFQRE